jgi:hypothetical protein
MITYMLRQMSSVELAGATGLVNPTVACGYAQHCHKRQTRDKREGHPHFLPRSSAVFGDHWRDGKYRQVVYQGRLD